MAKTIGLYSLAAPTNLTLSLVTGGSLLPNTTYYYQIFAVEYKFGVAVFSPRTATVSITTTTTSKSIKLTWTGIPGYAPTNADNNCYHILRNTSDSFLDTDACLMMSGSSDTLDKRIYAATTFTDTGTNHVDHYIPNYKGGLPVIYVSTGANEWVSMWDIWQADLAAGWGRVLPAHIAAFVDFGADKVTGGNWYSMANIAIGYDSTGAAATGYFSHLAGAVTVWGAMSSSASAYITWGLLSNVEDADCRVRSFLINYGACFQGAILNGVLSFYGLSNIMGGGGWVSDYFQYNNGGYNGIVLNPAAGSIIYDCDFPMIAGGWPAKGIATNKGCRYGGISFQSADHAVNLPKLTQANGIGFQIVTGQSVMEPLVTYSGFDVAWKTQLTGIVNDGTLLSHNQTDGRAWLFLASTLGVGGSLTFKFSLKIRISDKNDNPLEGASVVIKNAAGTTVSSGNTGADGKYDAGYLTDRVLSPTSLVLGKSSIAAAHEDTHIANGYLTRVISNPHTITITQAGYQDYEDVITVDRKMDLEIALSRLNILPTSPGLLPLGVMEMVV
ncbi:MAG: hypothetical protein COS90_02385 [Deltaproteobacteria bacterium CG07_land_8_20_14_0_80_60_11]|nr:MAG: hypothetical protein COS90_02385 [Deltaproteobacteria bacterium CG07_land_8_20_14_0_80_60_11]